MLCTLALAVLPLLGAVTDIDSALRTTLAGGASSSAKVQAAWAETLRLRSATPSGIVASGKHIKASDLDLNLLSGEIPDGAIIRHYVEVNGHGPEPLNLYVPLVGEGAEIVVYRRIEAGLFVEPADTPERAGNYLKVRVRAPGRFVVHQPQTPGEGKLLFPESRDPSSDPARKWHWRVFRAGADEVDGPVPLLLIHGAGSDRWDEFIHWARHSPEAAEVRQHYQIWDFRHENDGINAAIGLDPNCPGYEESIVAYLYRFLERATEEGAFWEGKTSFFPAEGPIALLSNSHGALKARAFMINYPEYGDRVVAAITLGGPNMGTPWATPEWMRHTASRIGLLTPSVAEFVVDDAIMANYLSTKTQSDLDMGWPNFDAQGTGGIPYKRFTAWSSTGGRSERVISPRDANVSGARTLSGYNDNTFEPALLLDTYCGGLDLITPARRGDLYTDKLILYASYLHRNRGWRAMFQRADDGLMERSKNQTENSALRIINVVMGLVASEGGDWPASPYRLGDGFIPLQSQLMLDGLETDLIYETHSILGWRVPKLPIRLNMDVINAHTLADPSHIRIWPGWSHLDTVTGRYNIETLHSEFFTQIGEDLINALPAE